VDDLIGFLRSSHLVKTLGVALLVLLALHLVGTGRGAFVFWVLVAAAVTAALLWGTNTTSGATRLTCTALASYAIGVVWLVHKWPSPLLLWAGITLPLLTAGVASFRSTSRSAKTICILMTVALPQALWTAFIEQAFAGWTMF